MVLSSWQSSLTIILTRNIQKIIETTVVAMGGAPPCRSTGVSSLVFVVSSHGMRILKGTKEFVFSFLQSKQANYRNGFNCIAPDVSCINILVMFLFIFQFNITWFCQNTCWQLFMLPRSDWFISLSLALNLHNLWKSDNLFTKTPICVCLLHLLHNTCLGRWPCCRIFFWFFFFFKFYLSGQGVISQIVQIKG